MAPKNIDKLIERYLEGKCTQEERDFIDGWYSSIGRKHAAEPVEDLALLENRILDTVRQRTLPSPPSFQRQSNRFWYYTGIAATILILAGATVYLLTPSAKAVESYAETSIPSDEEVITRTHDESKRALLPDGTIVNISPNSTIRYRNGADTGPRELYLEGEAYFDVAHNPERPFYVYAGDVITRVLGTSFIVRNRGSHEKVTVSVKTGKVTVYSRSASHKKTVLTPHQEAIYDHTTGVLATQAMSEERVIEEKKNFTEMHFEETPVPQVLAMLMKAYEVDIVFPEQRLTDCVLTSSFYEEGLYDRIDVICTAIGATYRIAGGQIMIDSQGCNLKPIQP